MIVHFPKRERRKRQIPVAVERRGRPQRGALTNPATTDVQYTDAEWEFLCAVQRYKEEQHKPYPTWREIYHLFIGLGYHK